MVKIVLLVILLGVVGVVALYFSKVKLYFNSLVMGADKAYQKMLGDKVQNLQEEIELKTTLNRSGLLFRYTRFVKEIITNLDMVKDGVTPVGVTIFILSISGLVGGLFWWYTSWFTGVLMVVVCFYLIITILRFISLMRFEQRESDIMDVVDLLAVDVEGGVNNAIQRYVNVMPERMKSYFQEFLDNQKHGGFSFEESMLILSDRLGYTFETFANNAIVFEKRGVSIGSDANSNDGDSNMLEVFSNMVENNRYRRELRFMANQAFNEARFSFLTSVGIISAYVVFSIWSDAYIRNLILHKQFGAFLIVIDLFLVSWVLSYLASIKAKL